MLWKFIDRPREDSLTAAIFSHLLHLPSEDFWRILSNACSSNQFPDYPGEPLAIHDWPNWSALGTTNSERVIPDLVIEFAAFDLIIEAKRRDVPMQCRGQWENELIAYANEHGFKKREVRLLAMGGIHASTDDLLEHPWRPVCNGPQLHIFRCPVHMCQWSSLLLECQRWKRRLDSLEVRSSRTRADIRILKDVIDLFVCHEFVPLMWYPDFDFQSNRLTATAAADQRRFRTASLQYERS